MHRLPGTLLGAAALVLVLASIAPAPAPAEDPFFAAWALSPRDSLLRRANLCHEAQLEALGEPSLARRFHDLDTEVYRVLISPTRGRPTVVRLEIYPGGEGELWVRRGVSRLDGICEITDLAGETKDRVGREKVDAFRESLDRLRFWRLGSWQNDDPGIDPTWWLVEGLDHGRYDLFERVAPDRRDGVRQAGRLLLEMAGLEGTD